MKKSLLTVTMMPCVNVLQMCESVNMYGFSWNLNMLGDRTDSSSVRVSGSHSWDFDTMVLKVLALAGKINICTS